MNSFSIFEALARDTPYDPRPMSAAAIDRLGFLFLRPSHCPPRLPLSLHQAWKRRGAWAPHALMGWRTQGPLGKRVKSSYRDDDYLHCVSVVCQLCVCMNGLMVHSETLASDLTVS